MPAAIEFREWLGGEQRIQAYCNQLAQKGGEVVGRILESKAVISGTAMTNIQVPLPSAINMPTDPIEYTDQLSTLATLFLNRILDRGNTFVPFYVHAGHIWVRLSAQIWLEESDFEWVAKEIQQAVSEVTATMSS